MQTPRQTLNLCERTLNRAAARGRATKRELVATTLTHINRNGGPSAFGMGQAYLMWSLQNALMGVYTSLMTRTLSHAITNVMRRRLAPQYAPMIEGATAWIALDKGSDAIHVPAITATPEQWGENYKLKEDIGLRVLAEATRSLDIKTLLQQGSWSSIADMLS